MGRESADKGVLSDKSPFINSFGWVFFCSFDYFCILCAITKYFEDNGNQGHLYSRKYS
jgi:hypothetical protein